MGKNKRYILIIFVVLATVFANRAEAQVETHGFIGLRKDTVIYKDRYSIIFQQVSPEILQEVLEKLPPPPVFETVTDIDAVAEMLKGKVKFEFDPNEYDDGQRYVVSVTCRNGVVLNFAESALMEKYYPDRDIIKFANEWADPQWVFNLTTGNYDYEPEYTRYAKGRKFRTVATTVFEGLHDLELQAVNERLKKYVGLINLTDYIDHEFETGEYFWVGEIFYAYDSVNDRWWRFGIKESAVPRTNVRQRSK